MTGHRQRIEGPRQLISPTYHIGEHQSCPSCWGKSWFIGRFSVECAACSFVMPLAQAGADMGAIQ